MHKSSRKWRSIWGTEQRSKDVVSKFAQSMLTTGMEQSATHAATKDVQITSSREECALGMGQKLNAAAVTDALKLRKWECVEVMGHIASHRMNLQRFHYQMDQHSMKQPELFPPARKRSFNHANNLPRQHKLGQIVPSPPPLD